MGKFLTLTLLLLPALVLAGPTPADSSPEARRAFDDLGVYYQNEKQPPDIEAAIKHLNDGTDVQPQANYLIALLKQTLIDEKNGRGPLKPSPFWGESSKNVAREFRKQIAKRFSEGCHAPQGILAALWLIQNDPIAENQAAGAEVLTKIDGPEVIDVFKNLLSPPGHNSQVVAKVIGAVGRRHLMALSPEVLVLTQDYRRAVRDAAVAQAANLGFKPAPFDEKKAFSPWLEAELQQIAAMVLSDIPATAKWSKFTQIFERKTEQGVKIHEFEFGGWLLDSTAENAHLVNWFGEELTLSRKNLRIADWTLQQALDSFSRTRKASEWTDRLALSQGGALTGQFESSAISVPEALVGVWAFVRGDKGTAAAILFPRYDDLADERYVRYLVANTLGWHYRDDMLNKFCRKHDYAAALTIGHHLQKPGFDHFFDRGLVDELTQQLADRQASDFVTLTLPTEEQWQEMRKRMDRPAQIKFLLDRLRVSNGHYEHVGYLGDGGYDDEKPTSRPTTQALEPIGPINELGHLDIRFSEAGLLLPYLDDRSFLQTYSYWRKFHPSRSMTRVNGLVASLLDGITVKEVFNLHAYEQANAAERQKMIADVSDYLRTHRDWTREQLFEAEAADAKSYWVLKYAVKGIAKTNKAAAFDRLLSQIDKYPDNRGEAVEILFAMDARRLAPSARRWIADKDENAKFWASLALFEAGGDDRAASMKPLTEVLSEYRSEGIYPAAIEDLLAAKDDPAATKLAVGVLTSMKTWNSRTYRGQILRQLLHAGRVEARDYIVATLADTTPAGQSFGERNGVHVSRQNVVGDSLADELHYWNKSEFDVLDPDAKRQEYRKAMSDWVQKQFDLIVAGKPSLLDNTWSIKANILEGVFP